MKRRYLAILAVLVLAFFIIRNYYQSLDRFAALKNSSVVIATVRDISGGRGAFTIDIDYNYNGKGISNNFGTYDTDSLKAGKRIRVLVSKEYPDKYIHYIGVAK